MPTNRQVWQDEPGVPGIIRESQIPSKVGDGELLVSVQAWAINPCDTILQDKFLPSIKYPIILGQGVAGIVEIVGPTAASKFKVGDRVFAFSLNNGFQDYVVLNHLMAAKIPDALSFSSVSVFPLCVTTSSIALFGKDFLGLPLPSLDSTRTGKSILIWGGG
jgi:NADPH:quinone reductase-like Zn-dependent oxidoreductase